MNKEKVKERVILSPDKLKKYKKSLVVIAIIILCYACSLSKPVVNDVFRTDIRFVNKYYSIVIDKKGKGFVEKGFSTYYKDPFKAETIIRSDTFVIDSVTIFWNRVNTLKINPSKADGESSAPRVEMYYNEDLIYDSYMWRDGIWDIFSLLIEKLPKGFNPFAIGDKPFE
ncbi:hypothetical protein [Gynurincola endophyticus]|uniref:hypothetical protein n=1 Tax=Gynurincola endophyticus TaxID=2479004 RepID=UPI000F8D8413|nr:hypothetical protein [Gynurincola endophyticus]